jgi:hypothetical protein
VECVINIEQRVTSSVPTWRALTVYGENLTGNQGQREYFNCEGVYFKVNANNFGASVGWYYYIFATNQDTQVSSAPVYQDAAFGATVSLGSVGIDRDASSSSTGTGLGAGDWLFSNATAEFGTGSAQQFFKDAVETRVFPSSPSYYPASTSAGATQTDFDGNSVEFI